MGKRGAMIAFCGIYNLGQWGEDMMGIICGIGKYEFIHKSDLKPMDVVI